MNVHETPTREPGATAAIPAAIAAGVLDRTADHIDAYGWIQLAWIDAEAADITKCSTCVDGAIDIVVTFWTSGLTEAQQIALIGAARALFAGWLTARGAPEAITAEQTITVWNDRRHRRVRHVTRSLRRCAADSRGGAA